MRSPSARNRPSARRWRFSRSSRLRLTSGFERLSIWERRPVIRSILATAVLDQPDQLEQRRVGAVAPGMDGDRIALRGAEHHQSHDRRTVDPRSALFDIDRPEPGRAPFWKEWVSTGEYR